MTQASAAMSTRAELETKITVTVDDAAQDDPTMRFEKQPNDTGVEVGPRGKIRVPVGEHRLVFQRGGSNASTWAFRDMELRHNPHGPALGLETGQITDERIELLNHNRNNTGEPITYQYGIVIEDTATGKRSWIDPVIENESGT